MNFLRKNILYIAWVQSLVAMFGSLYFSEVMALPPCILCWYQRIAMYPMVAIIAVGILKKDKDTFKYVLPLSITGWIISTYHNLLYYKIIPESIQPCKLGISCTTKQIEWLGFITIPLMAWTAFAIITVCMIIAWKIQKKSKKK